MAFANWNLNTGLTEGIYIGDGSSIQVVADTNTLVPGSTDPFSRFTSPPSFDGSQVVFSGWDGGSSSGVYGGNGGPLSVVADRSTPLPSGSGNFLSPWLPHIDEREVLFQDGNSLPGLFASLYVASGGAFELVADLDTPVPGGDGSFEALFGAHGIDAGDVVFRAGFDGPLPADSDSGVYARIDGTLRSIADTSTLMPGRSVPFQSFLDVDIENGNVAFLGSGVGGYGVYYELNGTLYKVIEWGDSLDGKTVRRTSFYKEGLSGNQLAFMVQFDDRSEAIYIANVPEPSTALLLAAGLAGLAARGGVRKRRATAEAV